MTTIHGTQIAICAPEECFAVNKVDMSVTNSEGICIRSQDYVATQAIFFGSAVKIRLGDEHDRKLRLRFADNAEKRLVRSEQMIDAGGVVIFRNCIQCNINRMADFTQGICP